MLIKKCNCISYSGDENETVVLSNEGDMLDKAFVLNQTGSYIWQLLDEEPHSLDAICKKVSDMYNINIDIIQQDIEEIIEVLCKHKLISMEG